MTVPAAMAITPLKPAGTGRLTITVVSPNATTVPEEAPFRRQHRRHLPEALCGSRFARTVSLRGNPTVSMARNAASRLLRASRGGTNATALRPVHSDFEGFPKISLSRRGIFRVRLREYGANHEGRRFGAGFLDLHTIRKMVAPVKKDDRDVLGE